MAQSSLPQRLSSLSTSPRGRWSFEHLADSLTRHHRYGTKSMLWYIMVCSMIGGISVSVTTGLGSAIVTSVMGDNQVRTPHHEAEPWVDTQS